MSGRASPGLAQGAAWTAPADRFEREGEAFHEALRQAYLRNAAAEPDRCVVVDAAGGADAVADAIWRVVAPRFPHLVARA